MLKYLTKKSLIAIIIIVSLIALGGYTIYARMMAHQQPPKGPAIVKAMQVIQKDTPIDYEYSGDVKSTDEVKLTARVSGTIVAKYVKGGEFVHKGQALYKIDSRQYESALLAAEANLAQAQASYDQALAQLQNAQMDNSRYQQLLAQNAISAQVASNQEAQVRSLQAAVAAQQANINSHRAMVQKARENLDDTVIYAPTNGKLSLDELSVGSFVNAGNTVVATIGSTKQMYVQFNVSENEYLAIAPFLNSPKAKVSITLSDGTKYPLPGKLTQVNRALTNNTGSIALNAIFNNPNDLLIPGMYAKVNITGETIPNALLIPQRAVQQLLEKSFVMVVGADNTSIAKEVKLGAKVGSFWIVQGGLDKNDKVIVEGLTELQEHVPLEVTMVTAQDLGLKF